MLTVLIGPLHLEDSGHGHNSQEPRKGDFSFQDSFQCHQEKGDTQHYQDLMDRMQDTDLLEKMQQAQPTEAPD